MGKLAVEFNLTLFLPWKLVHFVENYLKTTEGEVMYSAEAMKIHCIEFVVDNYQSNFKDRMFKILSFDKETLEYFKLYCMMSSNC